MKSFRPFNIFLFLIILLISLGIGIFYFLNYSRSFDYISESTEIINIKDLEYIFRNYTSYEITLENGHKFVLNGYGPCVYENDSRGSNLVLENKEYLDETTCNGATLSNDFAFYVGYFKTLVEAIHFGEMNYKNVNKYLYDNTDIPYNPDYSYYIDVICNPKKFGYVISFDSISAALQLYETDNQDDKCQSEPTTKLNAIHTFLNQTPCLKYLKVFFVIDVLIGDIPYMEFTIK